MVHIGLLTDHLLYAGNILCIILLNPHSNTMHQSRFPREMEQIGSINTENERDLNKQKYLLERIGFQDYRGQASPKSTQ